MLSNWSDFCDEIISCRVTIEAPHKHHHRGNIYQVTVDVRTPGDESVASRAPAQHHAHEDVYVAIRDALTQCSASYRIISSKTRQGQIS